MRTTSVFAFTLLLALSPTWCTRADEGNPNIDYRGFADQVRALGPVRDERRISEARFLEYAKDPRTVILDARSKEKYDLLHIKGAKHLSLPDITEAELAKIIPTKNTRVLIYCNNNFENEPVAFPTKSARASLNLHTYTVLQSYGYTNVYELGPLLDRNTTKLPFAGTQTMVRKGGKSASIIPSTAKQDQS